MFNLNQFTLAFPQGFVDQNLMLSAQPTSLISDQDGLTQIGLGIEIIIKDFLNKIIDTFTTPFQMTVDLTRVDLSNIDLDTVSFYSSTDGISWIKEDTLIDKETNSATLSVNHLTTFVLMGKRKDTTSPTTTSSLEGQQMSDHQFNSDVVLTLNTHDNDQGIDYTLYKLNDDEWTTYTSPLTLQEENSYHIEFYSADTAGNVEEVKETSFTIEKQQTLPEAVIQFDLDLHDVTITGKDPHALITQEPNGATITDSTGKSLTIGYEKDRSNSKLRFRITSLQYSDENIPLLQDKHVLKITDYTLKTNPSDKLRQQYVKNNTPLVTLNFKEKKNETAIIKDGIEKESIEGIRILKLITEKGEIRYEY